MAVGTFPPTPLKTSFQVLISKVTEERHLNQLHETTNWLVISKNLFLQSRAFQTAELIVGHNESLKSKFTEDPGQTIQQNKSLRERHFGVLVIDSKS